MQLYCKNNTLIATILQLGKKGILMKIKQNLLFALLLLPMVSACAQEPNPVVAPLGGSVVDGAPNLGGTGPTAQKALYYTGTDFFGQSCSFAISLEEGSHELLTKVDYKVHGQALPDIEAGFYRFDITSNSYNDANSGEGKVTMAGALLNVDEEVDLNRLSEYESHGELEYSLRIETNASSYVDFEEAMEEVIEDETQLAAYSSTLDQIDRVIFKVGHAGHYDAGACVSIRLVDVREVEFSVADHDGDHDHDHDHGN